MDHVEVCLKVVWLSKILPTFTARVGFEFLMHRLGVSLQGLQGLRMAKLLPTLIALVMLEFLMNLLDVPV